MGFTDIKFNWRIGFLVFCLVYTAWVVNLGFDNFDKVHSEYRSASDRLQPARVAEIVIQELAEKCRKKVRRKEKRIDRYRKKTDRSATAVDPCLSWPQEVLNEKRKSVTERLIAEKDRLKRRVVVFYISFGFFFLLFPMVFLYLTISVLARIFRNMKFSK